MKKIYLLALILFISLISVAQTYPVSYLVVAGGGGGASMSSSQGVGGGGGGAGGLLQGSTNMPLGAYSIVVGAGGAGGTGNAVNPGSNGQNSSFNNIIALGGGGAVQESGTSGGNGGSGGGTDYNGVNGSGTTGQGNGGGAGNDDFGGSGGGGAGGAGGIPTGSGTVDNGGAGGIGVQSSITGTYYAGGGGGGSCVVAGHTGISASGGLGGGGSTPNVNDQTPGGNGTANTGGGGSGASSAGSGGSGGSGVVILSFATGSITYTQSGGIVTTSGGNTIITFNSSGTFNVTGGPGSEPVATSTVQPWLLKTDSASGSIYHMGHVGIGNNNPQMPLDVTGNARISGNLYVGGGLIESPKVSAITSLNTDSINALSGVINFADSVKMAKTLRVTNNIDAKSISLSGVPTFSFSPAAANKVSQVSLLTNTSITGSVSISSLAGNNGGFVVVDSLGNLRTSNPTSGTGGLITLCAPNTPWMTGGNNLGNITNAVMGTCDNHDLVLEANSHRSVWVKPNGFIGINNVNPIAMLDITTSATNPNFNVGDASGNSLFSITSAGKVGVGNAAPAAMLDINTNGTTSGFNISNSGAGVNLFSVNGIGDMTVLGKINANGIPAGVTGTGYNNLLIDANGNVVKANSSILSSTISWNFGGNGTHAGVVPASIGTTDGNDLPIVTNNIERMRVLWNGNVALMGIPAVPTITNYNQLLLKGTDPNHGLGYNLTLDGPFLYGFLGGALGTVNTAVSPSQKIALQWDNNGNVSITGNLTANNIKSTSTTGYNSVIVDANGKLGIGGTVYGTNSVGWNVGGNTGVGGSVGTLGTTDNEDLVIVAGGGGTGTERIRVSYVDGATTITGTSNSLAQQNSPFKIINPNTTAFGTDKRLFEVKSNGSVYAREFYVQVTAFPDYVFDKKYKLLPLIELENYLNKNKHLPNVPSAKEIESSGIPLGEIQRVGIEKIEELYLYIIELNKKFEEQNKKIERLEDINKELSKKVNSLKK